MSQPPAPLALDQPRHRLTALDLARGAAVIAMVIYHTAWDLSQLTLIETDVRRSLAWSALARATAASFLVIAGISLVLAHRDRIRLSSFGRRLAVVALAAGAVTIGTAYAFPASYIFFGILHNIALSSLIALPFVRAHPALTAAAALACWTLPLAISGGVFDWPPLAFLGLGSRLPVTNDFVPVFPWTGFVLAGVAFGILWRPRSSAGSDEPSRPTRLRGALLWLGRHSLIIYILHQPLIYGALTGVRSLVGPNPAAEAATFVTNCVANCRSAGQPPELCEKACTCTVGELKRIGLWEVFVSGKPDERQSARGSALARTCLDRTR